MLTTVRYEYQPAVYIFPLPVTAENASNLDVRLVEATGLERQLQPGDYVLLSSNLIYALQPGQSLLVHITAAPANLQPQTMNAATPQTASAQTEAEQIPAHNPPQADTANAEKIAALEAELAALKEEQNKALLTARAIESDNQVKTVAAAGRESLSAIEEQTKTAVMAVEYAHADAEDAIADAAQNAESAAAKAENAATRAELAGIYAANRTEASITKLEERMALLEQRLAAQTEEKQKALQHAAAQGERQIAAATRQATAEAQARCRLDGNAWPQMGYLEIREQYPAGAILPLPETMRYYPGRNSLHIFLNGLALIPGQDYGEVGNALSNSWRCMRELLTGDIVLFIVAPVNAGQAAALAAKDAGKWAAHAQTQAEAAKSHAANAHAQYEKAVNEKINAARHASESFQWSKLAAAECETANSYANEAAAHAWQASIACAKPGIAAVNNAAQLARVVEGVYFINPHLLQAPTPFYGLWPVADLAAPILWDGVFFEGPAYERAPYGPPPACPCPTPPAPPEDVEIVPSHNPAEWLPCDHIHCKHHCHKDHDNA